MLRFAAIFAVLQVVLYICVCLTIFATAEHPDATEWRACAVIGLLFVGSYFIKMDIFLMWDKWRNKK